MQHHVDKLISHYSRLLFYLSLECFTRSDPYISSTKYDGTLFSRIFLLSVNESFSMFSAEIYFVCKIFCRITLYEISYIIFRIKLIFTSCSSLNGSR